MGRDRTRLERLEQLNQSGPVLSITGTVGEIDVTVGVNPVISLSVTFKTAGGDLSGTYPSPTVAKINGVTLGSTTATAANLLIASGAQWVSTAVTGDVTITSGGVTAIGTNKVTNAQAAQMATNTIKGNNTGGTANAADLTVAQVTAMLGIPTGGRLNRAVQVINAGTVSYTTAAGTNTIVALLIGGGAGGGGASSAAANAAAAGGGASGAVALKTFTVAPSTAYTVAVGAAGPGGANTGAAGTAGGNTTFTVSATTVTALGGNPGAGMAANTTLAAANGGTGNLSTNGDVNGAGAPGMYGRRDSGTFATSGQGGSSGLFGGGGRGLIAAAASGVNATGFGGGGGGALVLNGSAAAAGGNGSDGVILVWEYT